MAISFGGVDLLLHDLDGEVQSHVDQFMAENQTHWFGRRSPAEESLTQASIQRHTARVPMPCFNWPTPPQPRINTLYYPVTGATRWAVGLFLIDQKNYDSMGISGDGKKQFKITANQSRTFTENVDEKTQSAYLYPLTPKPIATSSNSLLILPLVDVRYFWQFIDAGNTSITASTTWDDLETIIRTQINDTVGARAYDAAYFKPDPLEFNRKYLNIAQLIDAVCASTGQRFYYDLFNIQGTKSFGIENSSDAETTYSNIDFTKVNLLAGGISDSLKGNIPAQVNTIFPHHVGRLPTGDGGVYSIANSPSTTSNQPTGTEWNIFTTAAADMTGVAAGYAANNAADLATLATKISADIYAWQQRQFDYTVAGLARFSPSAYEDYRLYDFRGTIQTRVTSLPPNVGPYTNWCQVPGAAVDCCTSSTGDDTRANELWPGPGLRVRLTEKLVGCGSAAARPLYFKPDGTVQCDAKTITIYDPLNKVDASLVAIEGTDHALYIPIDSEADVTWRNDAKRWEVNEFGIGCNPCGSGSGSGKSGSEGSEGSGSGISGERCWIGEPDGPGGLPYHKQPNRIDAPYATCGIAHEITSVCGLMIDDAGHVLGNFTSRWGENNLANSYAMEWTHGSTTVTITGGTLPDWASSPLTVNAVRINLGTGYLPVEISSVAGGTTFQLKTPYAGASGTGAKSIEGCKWTGFFSGEPPNIPVFSTP